MGRVHFRKDFWDCFQGLGKNWPIADRRVISNDPRINCGAHFGSSSFLLSKVANNRCKVTETGRFDTTSSTNIIQKF